MPELPEVETTRRGIRPHLVGHAVTGVILRERRFRWPIEPALEQQLRGGTVRDVRRRAKYLLIDFDHGSLILHLGMSGNLRVLPEPLPPERHDHVDFLLDSGVALRLNDPRRFGAVLWSADPATHPLLAHLGPEPLGSSFTGDYLYRRARGRRTSVKAFLMDGRIVVGVGNIYASEALYLAGIHPGRPAGRISSARYRRLTESVRRVLEEAIGQGGTTLRNFSNVEGRPGYFRQRLRVYGRAGEPCPCCEKPVRHRIIGQRATYFCTACQT